jgi:hypothetical protein
LALHIAASAGYINATQSLLKVKTKIVRWDLGSFKKDKRKFLHKSALFIARGGIYNDFLKIQQSYLDQEVHDAFEIADLDW